MKSYKLRSNAALISAFIAGLASALSDGLKSSAAAVDSFSDRLRAKSLRKAAAAFDKMAEASKDEAIDKLAKAADLRREGNNLFYDAEDMVQFARMAREEADDLDPPAPVLKDEAADTEEV